MSVIYASAGDTVTCENGHPICDFLEDVAVGKIPDLHKQLGNWRQPEPQKGDLPKDHPCAVCGARWFNHPATLGVTFHFQDGWRFQEGKLSCA